jgi:hypothetical protein
MNHPSEPYRTTFAGNTELDALLDRVREDKRDTTGKNRNQVAYDCWRMFEDLAERYKEEFAMRDRYKRQSDGWRDKALQLAVEARCPICVNGQMLDGTICQECHGKDCASVAYDTLRLHYKRVVEACKAALKLPRPWMDGGITYTEWDLAFGILEAALGWKLPEKHGPPMPHASDCASWAGEPCNCVTGKDVTDWRDEWQGQSEL